MWLGFCEVEVAPSPKVQAYVGLPVQLVGVAVAVNDTARGALPEVGDALAVHVTEQVPQPVVVRLPAVPVTATGFAAASEAVGVPGACASG